MGLFSCRWHENETFPLEFLARRGFLSARIQFSTLLFVYYLLILNERENNRAVGQRAARFATKFSHDDEKLIATTHTHTRLKCCALNLRSWLLLNYSSWEDDSVQLFSPMPFSAFFARKILCCSVQSLNRRLFVMMNRSIAIITSTARQITKSTHNPPACLLLSSPNLPRFI